MSSSTLTKKELSHALKDLMNTMPLNKITVAMICEKCDLNRQTFYYHFQDIYECLGYIYQSEVVDKLPNFDTLDKWSEHFLSILKYIEDNKVFCLNTFHSVGRDHLEMFLSQVSFAMVERRVHQVANEIDIEEEQLHFIINFYAVAFSGIIIQWLTRGCRDSSEELAKALFKMLHGSFSHAIENLKK